jgi:hypothetical protein
MPVGDVVRLRMTGNLHGHIWMTGVHFRYKTASATPQGLASNWMTNMMPSILPACCGDVQFTDIYVEARFPAVAETYQTAYGPNTIGQLAGEAPPGQLAAVVDFRTGRKGGRYRGRQMLPFGALGNIQDGRWTGGSLTALDAYGGSIFDNYGAGGANPDYELVVFSPEKIDNLAPGEKPRPGNIVTPVTAVLRRDVCRTLRRRAIGQGI